MLVADRIVRMKTVLVRTGRDKGKQGAVLVKTQAVYAGEFDRGLFPHRVKALQQLPQAIPWSSSLPKSLLLEPLSLASWQKKLASHRASSTLSLVVAK